MEWGLECWPPEVSGTTLASLKSSAFLLLPLICKRRFPSSWGWHFFFFLVEPGRAGKCNNVHKVLGVPWKKIQGIFLITAGLPIPLNSENPLKWLLHEEVSRKARLIYFFIWQQRTLSSLTVTIIVSHLPPWFCLEHNTLNTCYLFPKRTRFRELPMDHLQHPLCRCTNIYLIPCHWGTKRKIRGVPVPHYNSKSPTQREAKWGKRKLRNSWGSPHQAPLGDSKSLA